MCMILVGLLLFAYAETQAPAPPGARTGTNCSVTPRVEDHPPDDAHASTFADGTWYANSERTIWAWWWGKRTDGDYKILWVRPVGTQLRITGRRLDGDAPALTAKIPTGNPYTYQASAVAFPTDGCWEIEGSAGDARMKFVVRIP
jgi:hypothetical protein